MQGITFHTRHEFYYPVFADVLDQPVNDRITEFAVGHLASLETERSLHLVAFLQKTNCLITARLVIVVVNGDGELDFLDSNRLLPLTSGTFALFLLVKILAVILNAADRRNCVGRNFYQIQPAFAGNFQGFKGCKNTELLALFVNDADFAGANALIDTDELFGGALIDGFLSSPREGRVAISISMP